MPPRIVPSPSNPSTWLRDSVGTTAPLASRTPGTSVNNTNFSADGWTITGVNRDWSGLQIDSGTSASSIHLTNMTLNHLDYAFYENVPTTDLLLDGWTINDTGQGDVSVSFHQSHGTYRNLHGTNSFGINVNSSWMVSGGGNLFQ